MAAAAPSAMTLKFEDFPSDQLSVLLIKDVRNTAQLRELIVSSSLDPEAAVLNATLVPDLFVLHVAARLALALQQRSALKTRSLHAELVFGVGGNKHIGQSLTRFGVNETCSHLLIARFNATPEELQRLGALVQGTAAEVAELPQLADVAQLRKVHKVTDDELKVGSLEEAIASRIASRDAL